MRALRTGPAAGVLCAVLLLGVGGCGNSDDILLPVPGAGTEWPADPGWVAVDAPLAGLSLTDGVSDAVTGNLVTVGYGGEALEFMDGQWVRRQTGVTAALRSVISLGDDEFLAVGDRGRACLRRDGRWVPEATGTPARLNQVISRGADIWAVGNGGTVLERQAGRWSALPPAGPDDLVSVAALHDSLFVVAAAGDHRFRVWGGSAWGDPAGGPWPDSLLSGVVTVGDSCLYAMADSLYRRNPSGWRAVTAVGFPGIVLAGGSKSGGDTFLARVIDGTLWLRRGSWYRVALPADPDAGADWIASRSTVLVPQNATDYLAAGSNNRLVWYRADAQPEYRIDPEGRISVWENVFLAEGGLLLITELGLYGSDALGRHLFVDSRDYPAEVSGDPAAGAGRNQEDFYLIWPRGLYRVQEGTFSQVGTWDAALSVRSLAVTPDGRVFRAASDGVWRWTGGRWLRDLPVTPDDWGGFEVWPAGDGSLIARSDHQDYYRLQEDLWLPLGHLNSNQIVLAGADGTLFAVDVISYDADFGSGNVLKVYDARAGAFRNLWDQGMGPLRDLDLAGGISRDGEVLLWTQEPAMVFRLNGAPARADWEVVAGPLAASIRYLDRLPGGDLFAAGGNGFDLYVHHP